MDTSTNLVSLDHARKHLIPRRTNGKPIAPSTLWRWIRRGLEGLDGDRIKLAVVYCGNRPHIAPVALREFFDAVTTARLERHRRTQELSSDVTHAELREAGLE